MSNLRGSKTTDDEEFESLFESLSGAESPTPPQKESKRDPGKRFSIFKRRRQATGASAAVPAEEAEAEMPTFDPEDLKAPLDLDAARQEFLTPEPSEEPGPMVTPTAADEARAPVRKPKSKARSRSAKVRPGQLAILGVLLILVLGIYGALALIITRTRPQAVATPISLQELETTSIPTATPTPYVEPTATALPPTPTATPLPVVSTQFDLQVLRDPDNIDLRIKRGYKYLELRAYDLAVEDFEHVLALDSQNSNSYIGSGQAHFFSRRWEKAEAALRAALKIDENNEEAHFWLGTIIYYQGRYEEAADEFDWAAELNPENPRNEAWLALAAAQDEQLEEAEAAAERALALDDRFVTAYLGRAEVRINQENIEAAQGDLLYARNLEPYNFETLYMLGRFYADYVPERIVEAERLVLQAQNWATWDLQRAQALQTLGRIYLAQGRNEEARQALVQASDLALVDGQISLPDLSADLDRALVP
ncbi:MAG: tetratricopeptide repeat protein [Anaerolineae bacterium]|nr:tetratricopeptide repeat protein [Anaerolineae bacterium]